MCKDKLSLSFSGVHYGRGFQSSTQSGVPLPGLASEITGGWVVDPRAAGELLGYDPGFPGVLPAAANRSRRGRGSGIRGSNLVVRGMGGYAAVDGGTDGNSWHPRASRIRADKAVHAPAGLTSNREDLDRAPQKD
jgi:hypothetical protein